MCLDASNNKSYPTDLPVKNGLALWLDAADDTTFSYSSGTSVSQWRDKSGLNNHVGQSTVGSQPNRNVVKNSRKSIYFDGGDSLFNAGDVFPSNTTDYTKIAVVYQTSTSNSGNVISSKTNDSGTNYAHAFYFGSSTAIRLWHSGQFVSSANDLALNTLGIVSGTYINSSGLGSLYVNGTASGTGTAGNRNIVRNIQIGAIVDSSFFIGEICEVLVFSRVLSATELKQVHTYLGQKWGISNTDRSIVDLAGNDDNGLFGNGTVANMPAYDYYNKGTLRFDGSNDYVFLSNSQLNISSTITVEVWVKYNAQGGYNARAYSVITCKGFPWTWLLEDQSGQFNFRISTSVNSDSNVNSSYSHGLNTWNHVVGTYDGTSQKIYVDGVLRNTVSLTGTINTSSNDALVGLYNYGDYCLTGNVGAVRVYNKALSATEILQNYEAQKSKFANTIVQQGLVLNLDAGNIYSYAGAGTTWYDVSGNAIDASASGTSSYINLYGGLLSFPNNNSYYNTSAVSTFNLGASSFSMECWVYLDAATASDNAYRGIISLGLSSTNYVYIAKWRSGLYSGLYVQYIAAGSTVTGVYQANDYNPVSRWTHVVATKSSNVLYFYVNGVLYSTASDLNTTFNGNSSVYIAQAHGGVNSLYGYVGESRVYNIALSAAQVLQNYNATKGRFGL
jgi:hypothetical protein